MNISPRLKTTSDGIRKGSYPADIGTDHAYIPISLIESGICEYVLATDIRKGPLLRAEKNIKLHNLAGRIELRQGSGLSPVNKDEVDCAVMAGMGGHLICDILEKGRGKTASIEYFVFQPMVASEVLREYLYQNKFHIYDEKLVKENDMIYEIITAEHGEDAVDDIIFFEIGKSLIEKNDPLVVEFIFKKIIELKKVTCKIEGKNSENAILRYKECVLKLKKYEEVLGWLQGAKI